MTKFNQKQIANITAIADKNGVQNIELFIDSCFELYCGIEKRESIYMSVKVSSSGMSRRFNVMRNYNWVLNNIVNSKDISDPVLIKGCGMDMAWWMLYKFTQRINKGVKTKRDLNSNCECYCIL